MLGRIGEAQTTLASMQARGDGYYIAQLIVGKAAGEDPVELRARLQNVDRKNQEFQMRDITDAEAAALSDSRTEANRRAAALDARPAGGLLLASWSPNVGAARPSTLTPPPHFKSLLAESGLRWPPPQTINYPARAPANGAKLISAPATAKGTTRD